MAWSQTTQARSSSSDNRENASSNWTPLGDPADTQYGLEGQRNPPRPEVAQWAGYLNGTATQSVPPTARRPIQPMEAEPPLEPAEPTRHYLRGTAAELRRRNEAASGSNASSVPEPAAPATVEDILVAVADKPDKDRLKALEE